MYILTTFTRSSQNQPSWSNTWLLPLSLLPPSSQSTLKSFLLFLSLGYPLFSRWQDGQCGIWDGRNGRQHRNAQWHSEMGCTKLGLVVIMAGCVQTILLVLVMEAQWGVWIFRSVGIHCYRTVPAVIFFQSKGRTANLPRDGAGLSWTKTIHVNFADLE